MAVTADQPNVVRRLNKEWERLVDSDPPSVLGWGERHSTLTGCDRLAQIIPLVQQSPDSVLGALLTEHAMGDQLAGRVVVQAMLGKLVVMARRTPNATIDDFVAALWIRVATYPLASRPRRIAANLALDTLKAVTKECAEVRVPVLNHLPPASIASGGDVTARQMITVGRRLGLINGATGEAMVSVYADGLTGRQAAARLHISPEMVRYRCSDGTRRLARNRAVLLEAA